jgi:hypothetical protein
MSDNVFVNIIKCVFFRDALSCDPSSYEEDKYIGDPIIPSELYVFISDPQYADTKLWWWNNTCELSQLDRKAGSYKFCLAAQVSGIVFDCRFDAVTKCFSYVGAIDENRKYDLTEFVNTVSDIKLLLEMPLLGFQEYVNEHDVPSSLIVITDRTTNPESIAYKMGRAKPSSSGS